jgi:molybdenum cofactor cytidylyltransferase
MAKELQHKEPIESTQILSAVVLAAGTASRMGSPKQLLRLGSKTLLEHTLDNLRASQVHEIVVVLGAAAEAIRPLIGPGVKVVVNDTFSEGMGTSLQRGLRALDERAAGTLVVLADQPLVKPATIDRIIDEYLTHKPQILIPLYRGFRGNPVLLDRSVFPEIAGLKGDTGCRAIFGDHLENIRKLEVDDAGVLLDVDRPQDLETLTQIYTSGRFALPVWEVAETSLPASPDVVVVGRESVATAVVRMVRLLEYRVTVVDPLSTFGEMPEATAILRTMDFARLPETARQFCVVASMGRFDEEAIEQAVGVGIPYIALVANKKRSQEVLQSLGLRGLASERLAGVRTKPGISIGAQTQQEIGLSIVAEIVGELRSEERR